MKRFYNIAILFGLFAIVIIQLVQNKKNAENRVYRYDKQAPVHVFGEVLGRKYSKNNSSYSGMFESMREVKVSADFQGRIIEILVEEGQKVHKGQALLKLDAQMLHLQLKVLESKLIGLRKDESRYQALANDDAVPGINLEKTQNLILTAEAEKKTILEQIKNAVVRAPFDGLVSLKLCELGGFASPAVPLFELINTTHLKFVIYIPEYDLPLFTIDQTYHLVAGPDQENFAAKLLQVSSKGGNGNSFKVEFYLDKSVGLKPKMNGLLTIEAKKEAARIQRGFSISSKAIIGSESKPEIYLVSRGKARRIPIKILSRNGEYLIVDGQLKHGDTIVNGGFINLFANANVVINQ